jgi:hypothetical protein
MVVYLQRRRVEDSEREKGVVDCASGLHTAASLISNDNKAVHSHRSTTPPPTTLPRPTKHTLNPRRLQMTSEAASVNSDLCHSTTLPLHALSKGDAP